MQKKKKSGLWANKLNLMNDEDFASSMEDVLTEVKILFEEMYQKKKKNDYYINGKKIVMYTI